jgi:hypothetical protein
MSKSLEARDGVEVFYFSLGVLLFRHWSVHVKFGEIYLLRIF